MSEPNGNGNGTNGVTWRTVAIPAMTLLLGGGVGHATRGDDVRVAILEVQVAELIRQQDKMSNKLDTVVAALPGPKEKR